MKNWKTTLVGVVSAALYAAVAYIQSGRIEPKEIAIAAGIAALGALAKDLNVTGGTVQQGPDVKSVAPPVLGNRAPSVTSNDTKIFK